MSQHPSSAQVDLDAERESSLDRIIGLSDGIFAFSMTLLAVNVDLPGLPENIDAATVTQDVYSLAPKFVFYVTSFLLVGMFWQVHRRLFRYIRVSDTALSWLNLLLLMFVAFVPVATGLFDSYPSVPIVAQLYGGTLLIITGIGGILWEHAKRSGLLDPSLDPDLARYMSFRSACIIAIYALMVVIAFIQAEYSRWVLLAFLFIYPFLQRIYRRIYKTPPTSTSDT
ncbi:MAG TPA: TMEM175 family protein [Anaerolineae bacterium]|nr:TMEM175 family protein [Anaerolineae bacterium]